MKVHILQAFPGDSKGKTKDLDDITAKELIRLEQAVVAEDGSEHPEPNEESEDEESEEEKKSDQGGEDEADSSVKIKGKPGSDRKVKTDKDAEGADNK